MSMEEGLTMKLEMQEATEEIQELYDADEECEHEIKEKMSGIECVKCGGWFCY